VWVETVGKFSSLPAAKEFFLNRLSSDKVLAKVRQQISRCSFFVDHPVYQHGTWVSGRAINAKLTRSVPVSSAKRTRLAGGCTHTHTHTSSRHLTSYSRGQQLWPAALLDVTSDSRRWLEPWFAVSKSSALSTAPRTWNTNFTTRRTVNGAQPTLSRLRQQSSSCSNSSRSSNNAKSLH